MTSDVLSRTLNFLSEVALIIHVASSGFCLPNTWQTEFTIYLQPLQPDCLHGLRTTLLSVIFF